MEKYLLAAIESFLMQSLDQIELICIDDMSSDNSVRIISDVANDNENIHLFQMKRNEGVGIARRKGMSLAAGEYIAFIDADDLLMKKDALELLYNAAVSDDCDICAGFVTNFNDKCETPYPRFRSLFSSDKRIIKDVSYIDIQDDYYFQGFIYKRKFLEEHEIVFPPYIRNEDPPFLVQALHKANKILIS